MMTPFYERDGITIYCGDCLEVMPKLELSFDIIITSPPYNLGVTTGGGFAGKDYKIEKLRQGKGSKWGKKSFRRVGGKWDGGNLGDGYENHSDAMPPDEYIVWQKAFLLEAWNLLTPTGAIFYNHKPRVQDGLLQTPLELNPGLPLRQIIIWKRAGGVNFSPSHYLPTHEWIMLFAKSGFRLKSQGASGVGDVWEFPQESNNPHPAPFPVELPARVIETTPGNVILDPFCGSGSTLIAAQNAHKQATGIELSESYCKIAVDRLRQPSFFSLPAMQPKVDKAEQLSFES